MTAWLGHGSGVASRIPLVLIGLFERYRLMAKFAKYKATTYHPGAIQSRMSEEAVSRWSTGKGAVYK